jgi:stearoyl-CoA desaturase (delta-9 desaturase)
MFHEFTWWHIVYLLITTHITIVTVTVYLHRCLSHRSLAVSKPLEHFFRFWCWITTGQNPKEWAAVHRKHHAYCEKEGDPHSPKIYGIWTVLFKGVALYKKETRNPETIKRFGHLTPDDKLAHFYAKYSKSGMIGLGLLQVALFGWHGLWMLILQLAWIPFWAAGVVNGVGHFKGYRSFNTTDQSTNLVPWGIIIGGEELHNNHHAYPTSAKLSFKWYEFDMGWFWISLFKMLGLATINKVNMLPIVASEPVPTETSVDAILSNKAFVLKMFYNKTKKEVNSLIENVRLKDSTLGMAKAKELLFVFYHDNTGSIKLTEKQEELLSKLLANKMLAYLYQKKQELLMFWTNKTATIVQTREQFTSWVNSVMENARNNNEFAHLALVRFADSLTCLKTA